MKTGKHAFQKTCRDLYVFVTSAAKKGRKELFERQMSLEERRKFDPAKQKDIKNYVANDVLEKLEPHEKPPRESILRMRWVLEYRLDENENKSPKARIVILGYLDLNYENRPAASPTMTRNTRQLLLQFGAWMGFSASKGDVSGAFLQGPQSSTRSLGTASTRTDSSAGRSSDHQTRSRKRGWNLDSCNLRGHRTVVEFAPVARHRTRANHREKQPSSCGSGKSLGTVSRGTIL